MPSIKKWYAVLTIKKVNSSFALRRFVLLERWSRSSGPFNYASAKRKAHVDCVHELIRSELLALIFMCWDEVNG